jgi:archaellum component FlaC
MNRKSSANDPVNRKMLDEAVEAILRGVDDIFTKQSIILAGHTKILNDHTKILNDHTDRLEKLETNVEFIKQDINDIKADLSDTPSRQEFNALKIKAGVLSSS